MEDYPASEASAGEEPSAEFTLSPAAAAPETTPLAEAAMASPDEEGAAAGEPAPAPADDPLASLADEASRHRLSPPDEERATGLLKEALLNGREGVGRAIEALPKMPWLIGVNSVSAVWQEMKPTFRTRLLAGLGRIETEAARRVRLSLARGLFKQDVPAALKIAVSVCKDLREKETGLISSKSAHLFASVFIGRAKPWVAQLPLAELKPNEADMVFQVTLLAVFNLPHPPATQLAVLKWGAAAGRLAKLPPEVLEAITTGLGRWNGKWRQALYTEVKELPEEIAALVAPPVRGAPPERAEGEGEAAPETPLPDDDEEDDEEDDRPGGRRQRPEPPEGAITAQTAPAPKQRPVYESKTVPAQQGQGGGRRGGQEQPAGGGQQQQQQRGQFHLPDALRSIDQYVQGLRNELQAAQNKLRQRDDDGRRGRPAQAQRPAAPVIEGEPTPDELARLNVQLEARNAELQTRLNDLREDSEMRAVSAEAQADPGAQLRTLFSLKLKEDYEDFAALEQEAQDVVVQQHYRVLLRHVFDVLKAEGVELKEAPPADS